MGGFEVSLLNGCGPNVCFSKAFRQSTSVRDQNIRVLSKKRFLGAF